MQRVGKNIDIIPTKHFQINPLKVEMLLNE